jgi:hypothetical protein
LTNSVVVLEPEDPREFEFDQVDELVEDRVERPLVDREVADPFAGGLREFDPELAVPLVERLLPSSTCRSMALSTRESTRPCSCSNTFRYAVPSSSM